MLYEFKRPVFESRPDGTVVRIRAGETIEAEPGRFAHFRPGTYIVRPLTPAPDPEPAADLADHAPVQNAPRKRGRRRKQ